MVDLYLRGVQLMVDVVVIADDLADCLPGYRMWKGMVLDMLLGSEDAFDYTSITSKN